MFARPVLRTLARCVVANKNSALCFVPATVLTFDDSPPNDRVRPLAQPVRKLAVATHTETRKLWLSDPGTYPIIVIITCASVACSSFFTYNLVKNHDIRISKQRRTSTIRYWGGDNDEN
jgi:hypothetical protein